MRAGVFGYSLCALRHGVLGQLTRERDSSLEKFQFQVESNLIYPIFSKGLFRTTPFALLASQRVGHWLGVGVVGVPKFS